MKIVRDILRVLAVLLAVAVLASFFVIPFAWIHTTDAQGADAVVKVTGAQLSFGSDVSSQLGFDEGTKTIFKSGWFFVSFVLSALTVLFVALGFKFPKNNWAALVFGLLNSITVSVLTFSRGSAFVDYGQLILSDLGIEISKTAMIVFFASVAFLIALVAFILVKDKIEVNESNGAKLTIIQRIFKFFREYKSEIKKIVWPTGRSVVKNTIVVLVMCAIVLVIVWLVDLGMGELFKLVFVRDSASSTEAVSDVVSTVVSTVG